MKKALYPSNAGRINEALTKAKRSLMEAASIIQTDANGSKRMFKKIEAMAFECEHQQYLINKGQLK